MDFETFRREFCLAPPRLTLMLALSLACVLSLSSTLLGVTGAVYAYGSLTHLQACSASPLLSFSATWGSIDESYAGLQAL